MEQQDMITITFLVEKFKKLCSEQLQKLQVAKLGGFEEGQPQLKPFLRRVFYNGGHQFSR